MNLLQAPLFRVTSAAILIDAAKGKIFIASLQAQIVSPLLSYSWGLFIQKIKATKEGTNVCLLFLRKTITLLFQFGHSVSFF